MRRLSLLGALLLAPAAAAAQDAGAAAAPSGASARFSLAPRLGVVRYGDFYDGPMRYAAPGGSGEGTIEVSAGTQLSLGLAAELRLGRSPWSLYAAADRTSGDFDVEACAEGTCGTGSGDMSAWLVAAGLARDVRLGMGEAAARARLGAMLGRITVEDGDPAGGDATYDNPGGFAGFSVGIPLTPRATLDVELADFLLRADTRAVSRDLGDSIGASIDVDDGWMNSLHLSVGVRFGL